MEHGVYICTWSRSRGGFTLWVKSRPQIRASGPSYAEAETRFIEAIWEGGGAMHAVVEFDPPLPKSTLEEKHSSPELYLIGGDDRFETDAPRRKPFGSAQEREARLRWLDASSSRDRICRSACQGYLPSAVSRRSSLPPQRLAGTRCWAKKGRAVLQAACLGSCLTEKWSGDPSCRLSRSACGRIG